jgi:hypothetical protein
MSIEKVMYRAHAKATGGRDGRALSSDNVLDLKLTVPREMGGAGEAGTNPEQLFAAGYSACFLGALKYVAGQQKVNLTPSVRLRGFLPWGLPDVCPHTSPDMACSTTTGRHRATLNNCGHSAPQIHGRKRTFNKLHSVALQS